MDKNKYRVYYPVEYFNPHVHLEYDYNNNSDLNEAEIKALQYEDYKNKYINNKIIKNKEFINKYNKNVLLYQEEQKIKNKEEEMNKQKEKEEKLLRTKNFNDNVFEKNMKSFRQKNIISKSLNIPKRNTNKKNINHIQEIRVVNHKIENENNENNIERFIPKKRILGRINNDFSSDNLDKNDFILKNININSNNNNFNESINLNTNLEENIKKENNNINLNNNIIDLRGNIEDELIKEIRNKKKYCNNNEIKDEIDEKINNIKRFRNHGYLPEKKDIIKKNASKKQIKNKKFFSEFERRRFIKALKHIITERLGEHNIIIQNICNCGNLKKQLTALVEKGNLTVYALTEVECANNCVFYKNKKAYLKGINDVLDSIKNIAYENFHNKYKDKI